MNNEKKEITVLNGGVSEDTILTWKSKHRKVYEISVTDDNVKYKGYFKRPDMATMSAASQLAKKDEVQSSEVLLKNCWLGDDPIMLEDTIIKMEAITQLSLIFGSCTGELKNL